MISLFYTLHHRARNFTPLYGLAKNLELFTFDKFVALRYNFFPGNFNVIYCRVDGEGSSTMLNSLMYKMCYYRFGQVYTEGGK